MFIFIIIVQKLATKKLAFEKESWKIIFLLSSRYVQIIVVQLKDKDQDIGASTDEKYAAKNINKDYETKEEGETYITAEFDYGKPEFFIGDDKNYSRSKAGSTLTTFNFLNQLTSMSKAIFFDFALRKSVKN